MNLLCSKVQPRCSVTSTDTGFLGSCRHVLQAWWKHRRERHQKLAAELHQEQIAIQSLEALLASMQAHSSVGSFKQARRLLMSTAQNSTTVSKSCADVTDGELLAGSGGKVPSCMIAKQNGLCGIEKIKHACRQSCGGCDQPAVKLPAWGANEYHLLWRVAFGFAF